MSRGAIEVNGEWLLSFRDEQQKLDNENDAKEIVQAIENADVVEVLDLRGNTVGVRAGERLACALKSHPELKRALWSDMFTGRMKEEIPPVLRSLCTAMMSCGTRLVELDLSDNAFGPIGAEGIEKFLESTSAYSLEVLKLNNNGLGAGGIVIANALINCYKNARKDEQNFRLKTFIAGRNRLEDPGAFALANAFQVLGSLEEVAMYQDGIRPKGIEALAKSFYHNPNLKIINLSDNTFTVSGACAIAQVVRSLTKLEVLDFGDCLCRDKGALAIITNIAPSHHLHLKEINLSGNELSPRVIKAVLAKVNQGFCLNSLVLHTNNMGSQFDYVRSKCQKYNFIDLGKESDDQGTLDEDEDSSVEYGELYSGKSDFENSSNENDEETKNFVETDLGIKLDSILKFDSTESTISFRNQKWNTEGSAESVIQLLLSRQLVKVLDLEDNNIGDGVCRKIAEALRERSQRCMDSLEELNLSRNNITAVGISNLADSFKMNPLLKVIILSGNILKVEGAVAVAKALPSLHLLEVLDLSSCACQEHGIMTVVANLSSSVHLRLKTLDFSSNGLGADIIKKIVCVFSSSGFHLERLSLHSNNIGNQFNELKDAFSTIRFLDLGSERSGQGILVKQEITLSQAEHESVNGEDIKDHELDNSTLTMTDLHGRTQEITAALLCSFCSLLSTENSEKLELEQKVITLADAILIEAKKVKRTPISAVESICNQLLAFAGAVQVGFLSAY
ncbi:unnamed protein product [Thelazia callipaeda]|uniref:RanGAP1_C domain-containing protein n=1 Tax=Thelazia callipaeda TaxID=103827 RepID=A0A0N5D097_THECL|nr:unnamed protein product [Thelazia callipaeda]